MERCAGLATASARNVGFVKKIGADMVIDYTARQFEEEVNGVDWVLDTQGGDVLWRSLLVLKKGGIVVSTLEEPSEEDLKKYGVRASHVVARSDSSQLKRSLP